MTQNMGFFDRITRVLAALFVGILFVTGQISGLTAWILGAIAAIFLLTGAVGTCPLYLPFGISSRRGRGARA